MRLLAESLCEAFGNARVDKQCVLAIFEPEILNEELEHFRLCFVFYKNSNAFALNWSQTFDTSERLKQVQISLEVW